MASLVNDGITGSVAVSDTLSTAELIHGDGCVDLSVVDLGSMGDMLVDSLGGVVVLGLLGLSLDDWLDLLNDMFIYMLVYLGSVDRGRVGLLSTSGVALVLSLLVVLRSSLLGDILSSLSSNLRCDVLVVSVDLLLVHYWLNLLVDLGLVTLSVNDGGDLVVSVLGDVLVGDGVLDVAGVSSTDSVIDGGLARSSISERCNTVTLVGLVEAGVVLLSALVGVESSHNFVDDSHDC